MPIYVITGANRGLGLEFCRQLSADVSNIIFAGTRSLSSDLSELEAHNSNRNIHVLECDTSDHSSIESFAKNVTNKIGSGLQINYIINNAATNNDPAQTSRDISQKVFLDEINTNVLGPAKVVQALSTHIQKGSVVVNMSSGLGSCAKSKTMVPTRSATYSISKAALNMLTVHQAHDYGTDGKGTIVICMDPGWVKTRMGGESAILTPAESIGGVLKTVHRLGETDTGKFFCYNGEEVPCTSICNLKTKASGLEPSLPATYDILATTVQLCPPCYQGEEIAILTIYTTAITKQYDRKEDMKRTLITTGSPAVGRQTRGCDVEIANLKIELVESLTKLREGQGMPKMPEKQGRVKFDFRNPKIMHVKNWVGKENLWPDKDGNIELRDAPREKK